MNVLYLGIDNPIEISVPGYNFDDIQLSAKGVSITPVPDMPGHFMAKPSHVTSLNGKAFVVTHKNGQVLGTRNFRIKRLPDPVSSILGLNSGFIAKSHLKVFSYIKAELQNFDFDVRITVKSFSMTVVNDGEIKTFHQAEGFKITSEMNAILFS